MSQTESIYNAREARIAIDMAAMIAGGKRGSEEAAGTLADAVHRLAAGS